MIKMMIRINLKDYILAGSLTYELGPSLCILGQKGAVNEGKTFLCIDTAYISSKVFCLYEDSLFICLYQEFFSSFYENTDPAISAVITISDYLEIAIYISIIP